MSIEKCGAAFLSAGPCTANAANNSWSIIFAPQLSPQGWVQSSMSDRRTFLIRSALALAGITAGKLTPLEAMMNVRTKELFPQVGAISPASGAQQFAGFGWEISNINNNGADLYFEVLDAMVLNTIN